MKILGVLLLIMVCLPLNGFVVMKMWEWFIVPIGVGAIGIMQGAGIDLLITFVTPYQDNGKDVDWSKAIGRAITKPIFCLGFGWLIHFLMIG